MCVPCISEGAYMALLYIVTIALYLNFFSLCFSPHKTKQSLSAIELQRERKRRRYRRRFKQVLKKQAN